MLLRGIIRDSRALGVRRGSPDLAASAELIDGAVAKLIQSESPKESARGLRLWTMISAARDRALRTEVELALGAMHYNTMSQLHKIEKAIDHQNDPESIEALSAAVEREDAKRRA